MFITAYLIIILAGSVVVAVKHVIITVIINTIIFFVFYILSFIISIQVYTDRVFQYFMTFRYSASVHSAYISCKRCCMV